MKQAAESTAQRAQRGVSLVELMVGMAVGLLAVLVITGVTLVNEGYKRTTTAGAEAQINGAVALYTLQRDVQMGGFGLVNVASAVGCAIKARHGTANFTWPSAPVVIEDGADGAPDSINVIASVPRQFTSAMRTKTAHKRNDTAFELEENTFLGVAKGDLMIAIPGPEDPATRHCSVFSVSETPTAATLRHDPGPDNPWNHDGNSAGALFPGDSPTAIAYGERSILVNLGRLTQRTYSVSAKNALQVQAFSSDAVASAIEELLPNIVSLQAVYGKDTTGDKVADTWNTVQPADAAQWSQVVAVRIAVVARSAQPEREGDFTAVAPQWRPDGVNPVDIDITRVGPDWARYRYRVYETTVALRNMIWQS
jgi:type IV pilus assembly protein PilW